jgi:hypothetical protein
MPVRKQKFIMREVNEIEIKQRITDGYFNATAICEASDKDLVDYLELRKTTLFLKILSEETGIESAELIQPKNSTGEIWIHPQVAINLAQWATPYLAVKIPQWIFEWLKNEIKTTENTVDIHEFDDIDTEFTEWIRTAANYDPRKNKKGTK